MSLHSRYLLLLVLQKSMPVSKAYAWNISAHKTNICLILRIAIIILKIPNFAITIIILHFSDKFKENSYKQLKLQHKLYKIKLMDRIFIGIYPNNKVLKDIEKIKNQFTNIILGHSIKSHNIHLTIQFIGYVNKENVSIISNNIKQVVGSYNNFDLGYKSLGCFPTLVSPKVLWVGIKDMDSKLLKLKQSLDVANKEYIKPENRLFTPHLSIAKIKDISDYNLFLSLIKQYKDFDFGKDLVSEICLIKSTLKRERAEYSVIEKFALK